MCYLEASASPLVVIIIMQSHPLNRWSSLADLRVKDMGFSRLRPALHPLASQLMIGYFLLPLGHPPDPTRFLVPPSN
jgi:hypothetical protein